jgi:hypothetical protein
MLPQSAHVCCWGKNVPSWDTPRGLGLTPQQPFDLGSCRKIARVVPQHKVAALQPAAREQEPRCRWLIERTAIAGWLGSTRSTRVATACSVWSRPADHLIISGPAPGEPHRAQTSLLECAVHLLGRRKLTRTMPLNTDRAINRAVVAGCAISASATI